MRYEVILEKEDEQGTSYRSHLEAAAHQGSVFARKRLEDAPACPEGLSYLKGWAYGLVGRCGYGPDGTASPLTHTEVESWARLLDLRLEPYEVTALMELDRALRNPGSLEEEEEEPDPLAAVVPLEGAGGWPTRKPEQPAPEQEAV